LPCLRRVREEVGVNNRGGGIFRIKKDSHNYHVYFPSLKMTVTRRDVKFDEDKAMQCSLKRDLQIHQRRSFWIQRRSLRMLWSSHRLRRREWRHPLKQNHPEKVGREPEKLRDLCKM